MNYHPDPIPAILASIDSIEVRVGELKMTIYDLLIPQTDKISELENMVNPYSTSGEAICNYPIDEDYEY
jgi:hypothetical protein